MMRFKRILQNEKSLMWTHIIVRHICKVHLSSSNFIVILICVVSSLASTCLQLASFGFVKVLTNELRLISFFRGISRAEKCDMGL